MNDLDLLRQFSEQGSQEAFGILVARHVDLVYSAAKRQVRSPDLAKEVAQMVFLDLADSAQRLRRDTNVGAWLYVATRRKAIDVVRREARRQRWERAAAEERVVSESSAPWSALEPVLDEALNALGEPERQAILLRFFENRSLAEVSRELRCSEDAAQKRVSRAVERLRTFFAQRGVATVAAALASELSTHAVEMAPTGTAASILAGLSSPMTALAAQHAARAGVSSIFKVAAVAVTLVGGAGLIGYVAYLAHARRQETASLAAVIARQRDEIHALQRQRERARSILAGVAAQADALLSDDSEFDLRIRAALAHLAEIKRRFAADPRQQIPEMQLLAFADWFSVAQEHARWDTDEDWREAMANVRIRAINRSGSAIERALGAYLRHSGGQLPSQLGELQPFFSPAIDEAILPRYELRVSGNVAQLPRHATVIMQKPVTAIDPARDNLAVIGVDWSGVTGASEATSFQAALRDAVDGPLRAYEAAHGGKEPDPRHPEQLLPYFPDPEKGAAYVEIMQQLLAQRPSFKEENAAGLATNAYRAAHNGMGPKTDADLVPFFRYPEDAAAYLRMKKSGSIP